MAPVVGGIGGLGLVGTLIYLAFTYFSSGGNVGAALSQLQGAQVQQQNFQRSDYQVAGDYATFSSTVLGSTVDL